jgi:predicted transcriptional regulator
MGQDEVLNVLKENKRWTSSQEIASKVKLSVHTVNANLKALLKFREVQRTETRHPTRRKQLYLWRAI